LCADAEVGKAFFSEEKKQKTFIGAVAALLGFQMPIVMIALMFLICMGPAQAQEDPSMAERIDEDWKTCLRVHPSEVEMAVCDQTAERSFDAASAMVLTRIGAAGGLPAQQAAEQFSASWEGMRAAYGKMWQTTQTAASGEMWHISARKSSRGLARARLKAIEMIGTYDHG